MEERLELAQLRRQPGRLLDLEGELAGGGAVGTGGHDDDLAHPGQPLGDRLRLAGPGEPALEECPHRVGVGVAGLPGDAARPRPRPDRREVATVWTSSSIHRGETIQHARSARPVAVRPPSASVPGRGIARSDRGPSRPGDPDDQPAALGPERRSRAWSLDVPAARAADPAPGGASGRSRRKLAPCSLGRSPSPRPLAPLQRRADGGGESPGRGVPPGSLEARRHAGGARAAPDDAQAPQDPAGEGRLGRDHLRHPPGRSRPRRRRGQEVPGLRWAGQDGLGVRMGGDGRVERRGHLHGADDRLGGRVACGRRTPRNSGQRGTDRHGRRGDGSPGLEGRVRRLEARRRLGERGRARPAGRGPRLRVGLGLRSLHHRARPDGRDHLRVVHDAGRHRPGDVPGPPRPHGGLHRLPQPRPHREDGVHPRRHLRRPLRAGHRRRLEGGRVGRLGYGFRRCASGGRPADPSRSSPHAGARACSYEALRAGEGAINVQGVQGALPSSSAQRPERDFRWRPLRRQDLSYGTDEVGESIASPATLRGEGRDRRRSGSRSTAATATCAQSAGADDLRAPTALAGRFALPSRGHLEDVLARFAETSGPRPAPRDG